MGEYIDLIIILTSRRTRQVYREADSHVIELVGIQDEDVRWYLEKRDFQKCRLTVSWWISLSWWFVCVCLCFWVCLGTGKLRGENAMFPGGNLIYFLHRNSLYYNEHRTAERIQKEQYLTGIQITFSIDFLSYTGWTVQCSIILQPRIKLSAGFYWRIFWGRRKNSVDG